MATRTYLLSRVWVWGIVIEALLAAFIFISAGWVTGSLFGMSGVPLRLVATLVVITSVILLRLAYVMNQQRELLRLDEFGITVWESSGGLWPEAQRSHMRWEHLVDVSVVGRFVPRVELVDRYAAVRTIRPSMVAGFKGGEGEALADEIRLAHAEWRRRSAG